MTNIIEIGNIDAYFKDAQAKGIPFVYAVSLLSSLYEDNYKDFEQICKAYKYELTQIVNQISNLN